MAIKVSDSKYSKIPKEYGIVSSLTLAKGTLVAHDVSNGVLVAVTSSIGTTLTLAGVLTKAVTSSDTTAEYVPLDRNVYVIADCTNNTAANQLHKRQPMTNSTAIANTSSDTATTLGIFMALHTVGAASDKKLYGYFINIGQVTA